MDIFEKYGLKLQDGKDKFWFKVFGGNKLKSEIIDVDCSKSTQFISGMMLGYANHGVSFNPIGMVSSTKYFEMTKKAVNDFKSGAQSFFVPVDFSSLSYPLVFSIGEGEIFSFSNCKDIDFFKQIAF